MKRYLNTKFRSLILYQIIDLQTSSLISKSTIVLCILVQAQRNRHTKKILMSGQSLCHARSKQILLQPILLITPKPPNLTSPRDHRGHINRNPGAITSVLFSECFRIEKTQTTTKKFPRINSGADKQAKQPNILYRKTPHQDKTLKDDKQ